MAAHACISWIMLDKHVFPDMDDVIKIYLDTMVEMDRWIMKKCSKKAKEKDVLEGNDHKANQVDDVTEDCNHDNKRWRKSSNTSKKNAPDGNQAEDERNPKSSNNNNSGFGKNKKKPTTTKLHQVNFAWSVKGG